LLKIVLIEIHMHLNQLFTRYVDIINDESVCDVVHETHPEYPNDEFKKLIVIFITYAIVEISTMMIESGSTAVTLSTMF